MSQHPDKYLPLANTEQIKILINLTATHKLVECSTLRDKLILKTEHHVNEVLIFLFIERPLSLVER